MMRDYFVFDGVASSDFGVYIADCNHMDAPKRDIEVIKVPGRNGSVVLDNGRYENAELTYTCYAPSEIERSAHGIRAWLLSKNGAYCRLEDSFSGDYFRNASFQEQFEVNVSNRSRGSFDIKFNCKPQRYLKSGDAWITLSTGKTIVNPTQFPALPLIRVYGAGTLVVGSKTVVVASGTTYTDIDCEIQDAYCGTTNRNSAITLQSGSFPELGESTGINYSGFSKVEMKPRWWTL